MGLLTKALIGKEDLNVQTNTDATETFERVSSTGDTLTLKKIPDIWDGTGKINVAKAVTSATDPGDVTETIATQDLTHDVLKTKVNEILAALRVAGFFSA